MDTEVQRALKRRIRRDEAAGIVPEIEIQRQAAAHGIFDEPELVIEELGSTSEAVVIPPVDDAVIGFDPDEADPEAEDAVE